MGSMECHTYVVERHLRRDIPCLRRVDSEDDLAALLASPSLVRYPDGTPGVFRDVTWKQARKMFRDLLDAVRDDRRRRARWLRQRLNPSRRGPCPDCHHPLSRIRRWEWRDGPWNARCRCSLWAIRRADEPDESVVRVTRRYLYRKAEDVKMTERYNGT